MFDDHIMEELILQGAAAFSGMSKDGEMLYEFTSKLKEVRPDIYQQVLKWQRSEIEILWALGFLQMDVMQENPLISLTEMAFDEEAVGSLSTDLSLALTDIIRALSDTDRG